MNSDQALQVFGIFISEGDHSIAVSKKGTTIEPTWHAHKRRAAQKVKFKVLRLLEASIDHPDLKSVGISR